MQYNENETEKESKPIEENKNYDRVSFDGKGGSLFVLILKNLVLTLLTLGIYYFWGKVEVQKYFHQHTVFKNQHFTYHATGKEKLIGFLKGLALVAIAYGLFYLVRFFLPISFISPLFIILFLIFAYPFIVVGSRRYFMSRTGYHNIRFSFRGTVKELLLINLKGIPLSIVTLGFYLPNWIYNQKRFAVENSYFGNKQFQFSGELKTVRKLFIVPLAIFILIWAVGLAITYPNFSILELAPIFAISIYLTAILTGTFITAGLHRFQWKSTKLEDLKFSSNLLGIELFGMTIGAGLLSALTLYIGIPWAIIMMHKFMVESISATGELDIDSIQNDFDSKASAFEEGISEVAEAASNFM